MNVPAMNVPDRAVFKQALLRTGYESIKQFAQSEGIHGNRVSDQRSGRNVLARKLGGMRYALDVTPTAAFTLRPVGPRPQEILAPLVGALHEKYPAVTFVLFGSRARGGARRYSDFDLGVSGNPHLDLATFLDMVESKCDLEEDLPFYVDLVNLDHADGSFLREIANDWTLLSGEQQVWLELTRRTRC